MPRIAVGAVIVAAGRSERMRGPDKLWAPVPAKDGRETPLVAHTLSAFQRARHVDHAVLVVSPRWVDQAKTMVKEHDFKKCSVTVGGARRQDSVLAGLEALGECEWAIVHDGARPLVTEDLIERGLKTARDTGASCTAIPISDTVKEATSGRIVRTVDRSRLWLAQTPQTFRFDILLDAHRRTSGDVTDDASLVEGLGVEVRICEGSTLNLKVTTPEDLAMVKALLS